MRKKSGRLQARKKAKKCSHVTKCLEGVPVVLDLSTMGRICTFLGSVHEMASCDKAGLVPAHRIDLKNVLVAIFDIVEDGERQSDIPCFDDLCQGVSAFECWVSLVAVAARNRYSGWTEIIPHVYYSY